MLSTSARTSVASLIGLAGLAAFAMAVPAQAAKDAVPSGHVHTLRVCNRTHDTIVVATSYIPIGGDQWRNKGWNTVRAGACQDIFHTNNATFYARAEVSGDSSRAWGADIAQCVEYPGPYDFYTASEDTRCPEGEPAKFMSFNSDTREVFIWNVDP